MANKFFWIVLGVLSIIGGIFCLLNPLSATIAATTIAAWVFIAVGLLQIFGSFRQEGAGSKIWSILLGAIAVFLGYSIFQNPLAGVLALTTVVAMAFLGVGIAKVLLAFSIEDRSYFWVFLLSGAVSVVLALMIFMNFPQSAVAVLGILLGVDLLSNGTSLIAFGLSSPESETV